MSRKPLLAGNWKMHCDHLEAIELVQQTSYHLDPADYEASEIVVAPPATSLRSVQTLIEGDHLRIALAGQNCHWESQGAYTGEVSPSMLARLKVRYVICGHSERRQIFGESDEVVGRKARAVAAHDMTPMVCVGETLEQRESGQADTVVVGQMRGSLAGLEVTGGDDLVVAYEPVWAIGTGRTATPQDAGDMCGVVRATLAELYGAGVAGEVRVLYGGSVKPGNIATLMRREEIDGVLVGGASIDPEDFAVICRYHRL